MSGHVHNPARIGLALILVSTTTPVLAAEDCSLIEDGTSRLACHDVQSGRTDRLNGKQQEVATRAKPQVRDEAPTERKAKEGDPVQPEDAATPSWLLQHLQVRNALEGKSGASLNVTREHANTIYSLKSAVIIDFGQDFLPLTLQMHGWTWTAGGMFVKDTAPKKPIDGRTVALGLAGNIDPSESVSFLSTLDVQSVEDRVAKTKDAGLRFATTLVLPNSRLLESRNNPMLFGFSHFLYPFGGLHIDRHSEAAGRDTLYGGHIGLHVALYPRGTLDRVRLFADAVRARDFNQARDGTKRSSTYYEFGVEYAFTLPGQKPGRSQPTLALKRTLGANFLTGEADSAKTVLAFTYKLN